MIKKNKQYLLDFFQNSTCLLKFFFFANLSLNFSTRSLDRLSKFVNKFSKKELIFSDKAGHERSLLFILLPLFFSFFSTPLLAEETQEKKQIEETLTEEKQKKSGVVIITYEIFPKGEMLDRIRFWLRNEELEGQMYPKGQNFVDDKESMSRTVVIENLSPGKYQLQFLIPNKQGNFEKVPVREILIEEDRTLKIDQKIKPL